MVPSEFVFLDELPLTSSGKVDRQRLPDPAPTPAAGPVTPRTPTEAWVAEAFGEILRRERVGARDGFFDLGGNSLDAARLMTRLRARSGADLPLRVLFERPTVEALAEAIDAASPTQQRAIVPLQPNGSLPPIFGVGGHNGDVFCYRALARELGEEQPFYGLEPPGLDGHAAPLERVEELAAYFALQVRSFLTARSAEACIIAGYCAGGTIAFELARQLAQAGQRPSCLLLLGAPHPERYRSLPLALDFVERQLGRVRRHAPALAELPRRLRERRAHNEAASSAIDAALLARRRRVERATIVAVRSYTPARYAGGVCLLLPSPEWTHTRNAPLRWREAAARAATSVGPPGCRGDNMLAEPHVAAIAKLVRAALEGRCLS
jgi:thioesterase domain-containing protein/acyl carrier protein